jgi:hypothetical protein
MEVGAAIYLHARKTQRTAICPGQISVVEDVRRSVRDQG